MSCPVESKYRTCVTWHAQYSETPRPLLHKESSRRRGWPADYTCGCPGWATALAFCLVCLAPAYRACLAWSWGPLLSLSRGSCLALWWAALNVAPGRSLSPIFLFGHLPLACASAGAGAGAACCFVSWLLTGRRGLPVPAESRGRRGDTRPSNTQAAIQPLHASLARIPRSGLVLTALLSHRLIHYLELHSPQ